MFFCAVNSTTMRVVLTHAPSMPSESSSIARVAVIGGGPAGLMAAEVLSQGGALVDMFDAMPSV